jgi:hypothetical protein
MLVGRVGVLFRTFALNQKGMNTKSLGKIKLAADGCLYPFDRFVLESMVSLGGQEFRLATMTDYVFAKKSYVWLLRNAVLCFFIEAGMHGLLVLSN